jgi:hypothetical protein
VLRLAAALAVLALTAGDAGPRTWCQYRTKFRGSREGYCSPLPLAEAERECDARIQREGLGGNCFCTDDRATLASRCRRRR